MIANERIISYINSLSTEDTPFLTELEKWALKEKGTHHPERDAEFFEDAAGYETAGAHSGDWHSGWFFFPYDE